MNKKLPYNTSDLKPSRRDFLRLSGANTKVEKPGFSSIRSHRQ